MKNMFVVIVLLAFNTVFAQSGEQALQQAKTLYDNEQYSEAIPLYERYLSSAEKAYDAYFNLGYSYFQVKNYRKARENFRLAALYTPVEKKELLATTYSDLSAVYSNLGDDENAYKYAIKAYELDKSTDLHIWNAAANSVNFNKYQEALKILEQSDLPKYNAYNTLYGKSYYALGDYEKSVGYFETFFKNYDSADKAVSLNITDEKLNYFRALVSQLNEEGISQDKIRQNEARALSLYHDIKADRNEEVYNFLKDSEDFVTVRQPYLDFFLKIYKDILPALQPVQQQRMAFDLGKYEDAREFAKKALKEYDGDEPLMRNIYTAQIYIANLNIFLDGYQRNGGKYDENQLRELAQEYRALYKEKRISRSALMENKAYLFAITYTLVSFKKRFSDHGKAAKKEAAVALEILKETPSPEIVAELKQILDLGYFES